MTPKLELRFVMQKGRPTYAGGEPIILTKKVLQMRYVYDEHTADDWQTVPFDESVVLDVEGNEI